MVFRIEHRLGVAASAQTIWSVLSDIEGWPQWSDLYPKVTGALRIGQRLAVSERIGGGPERPLQPVIVDWVPDTQILWRATASAGLLKRTRYFEIEALSPNGCIFANGEYFDGWMSRYIDRPRRRAMYAAYEAFGEALSARILAAAR